MGSNGQVTYKKLQDGTWGLHGPIGLLVEGQTIQVATKGGKEKSETVGPVRASFEDGNAIADIAGKGRAAPNGNGHRNVEVMQCCPRCGGNLTAEFIPPPAPAKAAPSPTLSGQDDIPF